MLMQMDKTSALSSRDRTQSILDKLGVIRSQIAKLCTGHGKFMSYVLKSCLFLQACYAVFRFVMESGAKGCEVIVSGKLCAERAKSMKFKDAYMISAGQPTQEYIDSAVRHVLLRQGVLGIKVKIMLDWDPKGKQGPMTPLLDLVTIHAPKEEDFSAYVAPLAPPMPVAPPVDTALAVIEYLISRGLEYVVDGIIEHTYQISIKHNPYSIREFLKRLR